MDKFIQVAQETAKEAGKFLKEKIETAETAKVVKQKKGEIDLVTDADIEAQKIIIDLIRKHYPNHNILAEESERGKPTDEYTWAIDPIDGTSAFSCGLSTYSSSIALLKDRQPIAGAIYVALINEVVWAEKGKGAFSKEGRLSVSEKTNLRKSCIGFDAAYFGREEVMKKIASLLSDNVLILPMLWSKAASLALVAKGILDGYIQCGDPKVWDVAAGKLLVEEAGGVVTDFAGKKLDIFNINGYVVGNSAIHKQLLEFIARKNQISSKPLIP